MIKLISVHINPRDFILDSGPLYHEFHADAFIKEPWNAFSSLFFLVPVAFWVWKLRGAYLQYPMISILLPLLFFNGIGSTIYHAFRAYEWALILDWLPAFIMNLILATYMWKLVVKRLWLAMLLVIGFYTLATYSVFGLRDNIQELSVNVGYFFIGMSILIPSFIYLYRTRFYKWYLLIGTFVFLGLALLFRSLDYPTPNPFPELLPQGTHFLWHMVSALAVFTMGYYFYFIKDIQEEY
jgi:hypothetical protein